VIEFRAHMAIWGCAPVVAAALIQHAAMIHSPRLHFEDLEPANPILKVVTLSWDKEQVLIAHCLLNGYDKTCVKWFAPQTLSDAQGALVEAYHASIEGHAIAQGLAHRPIGFRAPKR
jgi:hypothetical protein